MELISDEYRLLNAEMHEKIPEYGVNGREYVDQIASLAERLGTKDILDYGCGKGTLGMHFPYTVKQYDPAIPKHADLPSPADIVVCTDVLEHVEPKLIGSVLDHLGSLTKKVLFCTIALEKAMKTLPDGRNAHLILEKAEWWFSALSTRLDVINYTRGEHHILVVCVPKGTA